MNVQLAQDLRAARARISEPGTWTTRHQRLEASETPSGKVAYCAFGAIRFSPSVGELAVYRLEDVVNALVAILRRRWFMGTLPEPTVGNGHGPIMDWSRWFGNPAPPYLGQAIAQFNNSTSQAEVLALFDEAIAEAEGQDPPAPAKAPVRELELA